MPEKGNPAYVTILALENCVGPASVFYKSTGSHRLVRYGPAARVSST